MFRHCLKVLTIYIALFACSSLQLAAQDYVHEGNITLSNQIEVNNFANVYSNITVIKGNLFIGSYASKTSISDLTPLTKLLLVEGIVSIINTQITTLQGLHKLLEVNTLILGNNDKLESLMALSQLEKIQNTLQIDANHALKNLEGLEQIIQIGDTIHHSLQIYNNDGLTSLKGLENLQVVGGNFHINHNDSLQSFEHLSSLKYVGRYLTVQSNASLTGLKGMDSLSIIGVGVIIEKNPVLGSLQYFGTFDTIPDIFHITENNALTTLEGLEHITHIMDDIDISKNEMLYSLTGLQNLQYCGGGMDITGNPKLTSLNGLDNLQYIRSELEIARNDILSSLNGLNSLDSLGGIGIWQNPKLNTCLKPFICDAIKKGKYVYISDNGSGCSDKNAIANSCGVGVGLNPLIDLDITVNLMSNNVLYISGLIDNAEMFIYSVDGHLLQKTDLIGGVESFITLRNVNKGIRIIYIIAPGSTYSKKIVIH